MSEPARTPVATPQLLSVTPQYRKMREREAFDAYLAEKRAFEIDMRNREIRQIIVELRGAPES